MTKPWQFCEHCGRDADFICEVCYKCDNCCKDGTRARLVHRASSAGAIARILSRERANPRGEPNVIG